MTNAAMPTIRTTECSGCHRDIRLDLDAGTVSVAVESNRVRGDGHVPAHDEHGDAWEDGFLISWDCPKCGYADSLEVE